MIGKILKELREEKEITQQQLADTIKISQSKIARYELNKSEPKASEIKKFCKFFNISADYLIGIENEFGIKEEFEYTDGTHQIKHKKERK